MITEQTVKDFQEAIQVEYGTQLEADEARSVLENWVGYFDLLAKVHHRMKINTKE